MINTFRHMLLSFYQSGPNVMSRTYVLRWIHICLMSYFIVHRVVIRTETMKCPIHITWNGPNATFIGPYHRSCLLLQGQGTRIAFESKHYVTRGSSTVVLDSPTTGFTRGRVMNRTSRTSIYTPGPAVSGVVLTWLYIHRSHTYQQSSHSLIT
jgi:hypothetical protein